MTVVEDDGWDTRALLVDGWVERRPRRPEVIRHLRVETRLLPWLAPLLPLKVPLPRIASEEPFVVRHLLVPGDPLHAPGAAQGRQLGAFLRSLHAADAGTAAEHGVFGPADVRAQRVCMVERFRTRIVPLLPADRREAAAGTLDGVAGAPADRLVHADIGPAHLLACDGLLTGVIDFGDVHIGDPAEDFGWALFGAPRVFADAVAATYGVTRALRARASCGTSSAPGWRRISACTPALRTSCAAASKESCAGPGRRTRRATQGIHRDVYVRKTAEHAGKQEVPLDAPDANP